MARYRIPRNAGHFHVDVAMAGNYIVLNDKTGGGKVVIPCRDREHAERLCEKLNREEHDGDIWT